MSGAWQSLQGGLGALGNGISGGLSALGSMAGDIFGGGSGGQPMSGSPSATPAGMSQGGGMNIPDISGGASPTLSATSFGSPGADLGMSLDLPSLDLGGGDDALSRMLSGASSSSDALAGADSDLTKAGGADIAGKGVAAPAAGGFSLSNLLSPRNLVPAASLVSTIIRGNQVPPEIQAMTRMARNNAGNGAVNSAGATQAMLGNLPGGAQASIDQALAAAQARIRSNYAALGMTGSTPEAQDLAYAELAASAQAFQIGQGMAQTGFTAAAGQNSLASQLYAQILASETARGTALGDALSEFAAGLVDPDRVLGGKGP